MLLAWRAFDAARGGRVAWSTLGWLALVFLLGVNVKETFYGWSAAIGTATIVAAALLARRDRAAALRAARHAEMNQAALAILRLGHVPVIGVNMALPIIAAAEGDVFDEVMMPISLALAERCDAVLRLGGPSQGADQEVARFRQAGKPVFRTLADIPPG
jgi:hypothetical protein